MSVMMMVGIVPIMMMVSSRFRACCERKKQCTRDYDSTHTVFLRVVLGNWIAMRSEAVWDDHVNCGLTEEAELLRPTALEEQRVATMRRRDAAEPMRYAYLHGTFERPSVPSTR